MLSIIILILSALCVVLIRLLRSLSTETVRELKHRAKNGDIESAKIYQLRSRYGAQLHVLIVMLIIISACLICTIAGRYYPFDFAVIATIFISILVIGLSFIGNQTIGLVSGTSKLFESVLRFTSPVLKYPASFVDRYIPLGPNKKISSKAELLALLEEYGSDSQLTQQERKAVRGSLTYADKQIKDIMIAKGVVKTIGDTEELSPVVISELHDSGYSRFPVAGLKGEIVGTLYIKDAINLKQNKLVSSVMRKEVYYLNEEQTLYEALRAFLKTKHHLFMVVNSYEDIVGIVTIEDVLEQIIGEKIIDEFDQYDDMKVMAERLAAQKREERT